MRQREQLARPSPNAAGKARPGSDAHRVFLLECRLEQMRASVDEARAEAHRTRELLAEATAREAEHARRHQHLHEELAAAREEVGSLHRRLEHSEALRAGLEGRLFESATPEDAQELVRLRGEVAAHRDLTVARQRVVADLRARVEELVASRETLLSRVAEWQHAAREGDAGAVDLAEFIAALSHDILELEHRSVTAEQREAGLREKLLQASSQGDTDLSAASEASDAPDALTAEAGKDRQPAEAAGAADEPEAEAEPAAPPETGTEPGAPPETEAEPVAPPETGTEQAAPPDTRADQAIPPATTDDPQSRIDALLRLGRSGKTDAFDAIRSELAAPEPGVRAAAYQALGQLLEHDPARLEPHIRQGIGDSDPRVRRRVVLAAAAARGLGLQSLLDPLRHDPDSQVRRVVQEVLRRTPSAADDAGGTDVAVSGAGS